METSLPQKFRKRNQPNDIVYSPCQITQHVILPITAIDKKLKETLENTIAKMVGGKCIVEGYVKPNSVAVITYSSGIIKGSNVIFDVVFKCDVCYPVAGMILNCIAKNITKAGIRAESSESGESTDSPFVLFIARDHFYSNDNFQAIKVNEIFKARVIAQRFELNDKYISIIAEPYVEPPFVTGKGSKPMLIL